MRITAKGQVTIPQEVHERACRAPTSSSVRLIKTTHDGPRKTRGQNLVDRLRGGGDFKMTRDEILALMRGPPADEDAPPRR
jgi:hypothetical protein